MNYVILLPLLLGLLVTFAFLMALRPVAVRIGLVDRPGGRKMHIGEVPVIGGLAMSMGLIACGAMSQLSISHVPSFYAACAILVIIGALDDRFNLPYRVRIVAQLCAVLLMVAGADVVVGDLGRLFTENYLKLGPLAIPFTLAIVLTATNAFNMFDGSDGVAGGQAVVGLFFMGIACVVGGAFHHLPVILGLMGCVIGFLFFNWPAMRTHGVRVFMGDAGSTMLGFCLAWISIELSQGPNRVFGPSVALWFFALPLFDLFSSFLRRIQNGRSPFHADSEHLHHILRRFGLSSQQIAIVLMIVSASFSGAALFAYNLGVRGGPLFTAWFVSGAIYHLVFGSGLLVKRRRMSRPEGSSTTVTTAHVVQDGDKLATHRVLQFISDKRDHSPKTVDTAAMADARPAIASQNHATQRTAAVDPAQRRSGT